MRQIPKFHLISWSGNFVEMHSFRRVSDESPETYAFQQNFQTRKLGEVMVFFAVIHGRNTFIVTPKHKYYKV